MVKLALGRLVTGPIPPWMKVMLPSAQADMAIRLAVIATSSRRWNEQVRRMLISLKKPHRGAKGNVRKRLNVGARQEWDDLDHPGRAILLVRKTYIVSVCEKSVFSP